MPFVHADGLRLFYQDSGSGPPLLLLMGHACRRCATPFAYFPLDIRQTCHDDPQ